MVTLWTGQENISFDDSSLVSQVVLSTGNTCPALLVVLQFQKHVSTYIWHRGINMKCDDGKATCEEQKHLLSKITYPLIL